MHIREVTLKSIALVIIGLTLASLSAMADKESEKGRADDCFEDLKDLGAEMNARFGRDDQWKINAKFTKKKEQCHKIKTSYEKNYGPYSIPGTQKSKAKPQNTLKKASSDDLIEAFCKNLGSIRLGEEQIEMQKDNPTSVKQHQDIVTGDKKLNGDIQSEYKKRTGSQIEISECDWKIFTEAKYLRSLRQQAICYDTCVTADKDPAQIQSLFCRASPEEKEVLNKLHRALTKKDAFCKP